MRCRILQDSTFYTLPSPIIPLGGVEKGATVYHILKGETSLSQKPIITGPVASALNSQASALLALWFIC